MAKGSGDRAIGVIFFLSILAMSVAFFFIFTLKRATKARGDKVREEVEATTRAANNAVAAQPVESAAQARERVSREAIGQLIGHLEAGDSAAVEQLFDLGDGDVQRQKAAALLLGRVANLGYLADPSTIAPLPEDPTSYGVIFSRPPVSNGGAIDQQGLPNLDSHRVDFDLAEVEEQESPRFQSVSFPDALRDEILSPKKSVTDGTETRAKTPVDPDKAAATIVAKGFMNAIIAQDYATARALCINSKLPAEKVAALCFVFEDAGVLASGKPPVVRVTAATQEAAWAIAKVDSPIWNKTLEFGMEIEPRRKNNIPEGSQDGADWGIGRINLSEILASYAARTDAGEIPYTPIVSNPDGGERLAVYFPYDSDDIHPRARRQLDVIAQLLREDPDKKIRITGHADALGSVDYNAGLSAGRAVGVRDHLIQIGIPTDQIIAEAAGELVPLQPNENEDGTDNPEGRALNRRAEIYLDF